MRSFNEWKIKDYDVRMTELERRMSDINHRIDVVSDTFVVVALLAGIALVAVLVHIINS